MKQTLNTHACSLGERSGGAVTGESGGARVPSGMRGKATAVSRARRENSETVAKR